MATRRQVTQPATRHRAACVRQGLDANGRTARAKLRVRTDGAPAGQLLHLDVIATDNKGRRQIERHAGSLQVIG
jgi:hypothetical protein